MVSAVLSVACYGTYLTQDVLWDQKPVLLRYVPQRGTVVAL